MPSFGYGVLVGAPEDAGLVGLVLAEQRLGGQAVGAGRGIQPVAGERVVADPQRRAVALDARARRALVPRPGVAEPQRGQHVEGRLVGPVVLDDDAHAARRSASPWRRSRRPPSTGRRRRRRCRAARARGRRRPAAVVRRAARRGTRPAGSGSATCSRAWLGRPSRYHQYSLASSPWLPSGPVSPNIRSLRIGSLPFHRASPRQSSWRMSEMPAMPSSFHRYARDRAWSCGKERHASPSAE